jgi:hypothetical protein
MRNFNEGFVFVQLRTKYTVHEASVDRGMGTLSTYRGRVEIGGVCLPSLLERTLQFVREGIDKVKRGGRTPPPSPA